MGVFSKLGIVVVFMLLFSLVGSVFVLAVNTPGNYNCNSYPISFFTYEHSGSRIDLFESDQSNALSSFVNVVMSEHHNSLTGFGERVEYCNRNSMRLDFGDDASYSYAFILATNRDLNIKVQTGARLEDNDENCDAYAAMLTFKTNSFSEGFTSAESLGSLPESNIYYSWTSKHVGAGGWSYGTATGYDLTPGIYVIYVLNSCNGEEGFNNDNEQCRSRILFDDVFINVDELDNSDFLIFNSVGDFNNYANFPNYFQGLYDDSKISCELSGFDWEESHETNNCCDSSDEGVAVGNNLCLSGVWVPTLPSEYALLEENNFDYLGNVDELYTLEEVFAINDGSDLMCGDDSLTDIGYVTSDDRYFCSEDYFNFPASGPAILYPDEINLWKWWDAKGQGNPFLFHIVDETYYVSNADTWNYCAANGESLPGIPIAEAQTFVSATEDGSFTCQESINMMSEFFTNEFPGGLPEGFPGYFRNCEAEIGTNENEWSFCCDDLASYELGDFRTDCGNVCYVSDRATTFERWYDDYSQGEVNQFAVEFCTFFPYSDICEEYIDGPNSGDYPAPNSEFLLKDLCSFSLDGCLDETINFDQDCDEDLQNILYTPEGETLYQEYSCYSCPDGQTEFSFCREGFFIYTSDHPLFRLNENGQEVVVDPEACFAPSNLNDVCGSVNEDDITMSMCEDNGGSWLEYNQNQDLFICDGKLIGPNCCFGSWDQGSLEQYFNHYQTQNGSFICYAENEYSRFAECCNDFSACNNRFDLDGSYITPLTSNLKDYGVYGKGGVLHTIDNFDKIRDNRIADYVKKTRASNLNTDFILQVNVEDNTLEGSEIYNLRDMSSFTHLEFDVAFNLPYLGHIKLKMGNGELLDLGLINDYFVNGNSSMRWHHVVIPLSGFPQNSLRDIREIQIYSRESGVPATYSVLFDNFFLRDETGNENTQNYYCTGNFGGWVSNLDGKTDEGFSPSTGFIDKGPYHYACESQASFDWTGLRCCGDDTREPYKNGDATKGEYYSDLYMGCFHGNPVYNNWRVGDTLNDPTFNDLVYLDENYHQCINNDKYDSLKVNYDGKTPTAVSIMNPQYKHDPFESLGDWFCDPYTGSWVDIDDVSKTRIIAAKMYNLTFMEGGQSSDYTIYCDEIVISKQSDESDENIIVPYSANNVNLVSTENIGSFCTLNFFDNLGDEHTLIGLSYKGDKDEFLGSLFDHARYIATNNFEEGDRQDFIDMCDSAQVQEGEFFAYCGRVGELKSAISEDFKIIFLTMETDNTFEGLFELSFFESIWNFFTDLFRSWFGVVNNDGYEMVPNSETLLPLPEDATTFDKLYLSGKHYNGKWLMVKGFLESGKTGLEQNSDRFYYTMEFDNFVTSVKPLADIYYDDQLDDEFNPIGSFYHGFGYLKGENKQFISLRSNEAGEITSSQHRFVKDFDWRRLSSMLRIDASVEGGEIITSSPNDGVVDYGEWCDFGTVQIDDGNNEEEETPLMNVPQPIFRYNNNSCEFWMNGINNVEYVIYTDGFVTCNEDQTLNFDDCEEPFDCIVEISYHNDLPGGIPNPFRNTQMACSFTSNDFYANGETGVMFSHCYNPSFDFYVQLTSDPGCQGGETQTLFNSGIDACRSAFTDSSLRLNEISLPDCSDLCGNGALDGNEECDGSNLNGETCMSIPPYSDPRNPGTLSCTDTCTFDISNCPLPPDTRCGNGIIEQEDGEECDGTHLNWQTCRTLGYEGGTLSCSNLCQYDESDCTNSFCGDGVINPDLGEVCDNGEDVPEDDCDANCQTIPLCGNGYVNDGEECDVALDITMSCSQFDSNYQNTHDLTCNDDCTVNVDECLFAI